MRHTPRIQFTSLVVSWAFAATTLTAQARTPQQALDDLLETDRGHAAAATALSPAEGILRLLAPDAVMPAAPGVLLQGRAAIERGLSRDTLLATGTLRWAPVRGGIAADGQHGFTYGYMELARANGSRVPMKYLAYWVRTDGQWHVVAYKRRVRPAGEVRDTLLPPLLPGALRPGATQPRDREKDRQSLGEAEFSFSDLAGKIGLGPAFERTADAAAMNMGGPGHPAFVFGPAAIGRAVGGDTPGPSPVTWGPTVDVIVASSGDLGVVIGFIKPRTTGASEAAPRPDPRGMPFFTVWRRESPRHPWKFVAE